MIHVFLTTCDRPEFCTDLVGQLAEESKSHRLALHIADDETDICPLTFGRMLQGAVEGSPLQHNLHFTRYKRHGKERFWLLLNRLFIEGKKRSKRISSADLVCLLQDDFILCRDFFLRATELWDSIEDRKKALLNPMMFDFQRGMRKWSQNEPTRYSEDLWESHWNDCCFIGLPWIINALFPLPNLSNPPEWVNSSGVGRYITGTLRCMGMKMYQVEHTLIAHGAHASVMHGDLRAEVVHDNLRTARRVGQFPEKIVSRRILLQRSQSSSPGQPTGQ